MSLIWTSPRFCHLVKNERQALYPAIILAFIMGKSEVLKSITDK